MSRSTLEVVRTSARREDRMGSRPGHDVHDDFGGLHRDLRATGAAMGRRGLLRLAARAGMGVGALQLIGCGSSPTSAAETPTGSTTTGSSAACTAKVPEETQGPYPA